MIYEWKKTPPELRSALCDLNETPLSCRSKQCGSTWTWTPLQEHLFKNIVIFSLFCNIFDQVWSLEKCEL